MTEFCEACPLKGRTGCVGGEYRAKVDGEWYGRVDAPRSTPLMVLGAAPGFQEEQQGRPFIGPSGALLMRELDQLGITEGWFTNVAQCVPLDYGEPEKAAVSACRARLDEEIARVRPKFVLALGNVAVQRLLAKGTVTSVAGKEQWSARHSLWVLPAFHPAYLLRSPGRINAWRLDLARFARFLRGDVVLPAKPDARAYLVDSREHLEFLIRRLGERAFTFDFETSGLDWWSRDFRAHSIAFAFDPEEAHVIVSDRLPEILSLIPVSHEHPRIAHNAMFDSLVWHRITGQMPYVAFDTMLAAHLLDENRLVGLKWLGRVLLGWPDWDIDLSHKKGEGASLEDLVFYNGCDAVATLRLYYQFKEELRNDRRLGEYWRTLEMPKLRALIRMVARGVYVDMPQLRHQRDRALQNWVAAKELVPVENPGSAPQVAQWLYGDLGLTPLKMGKTHGSTDESSIRRLAQEHPEVRAILPVRKWARYVNTYFVPINDRVMGAYDERYHPDIRAAGTETGRLSSPFHTIPRPTPEDGAFVRSIFSAPHTLVEADYSQIEARLAAWAAAGKPASWDEVDERRASLLLMFRDRRDPYREMAAMNIYGSAKYAGRITENERQVMGKVVVLAMLYRIGVDGLREYAWSNFEIDWSKKQASRNWLGFHKLFPEFSPWHLREEKILRARGWTQTAIGRRRRLPEAMGYGYAASAAINAGINAPIQGLASDLTQMSMVILDHYDVPIVGNIHDALLIEVPKGVDPLEVERVLSDVMTRECLRRLEPLGLTLPEGLIEIECKFGNWGQSVSARKLAGAHL